MIELKWTRKKVIMFLDIFQKYPCLWDVSFKDYLNRNAKDASYNNLLQEISLAGIPGSLEAIKKIKSLRDTFRKELQKSKKSGAGTSEVYKPKLVWFSAAEVFWHSAVSGRESSSNLDIQRCSTTQRERNLSNDDNRDAEHTPEQVASEVETLESTITTPSSSIKRPSPHMQPPQRAKVLKRLSGNKQTSSRFENAVNELQRRAEITTADTEDQYDQFSEHIAAQFRELPLRSFILLQSKIQNIITEERLSSLYASEREVLSNTIDSLRNNNEGEETRSELSSDNRDIAEEEARHSFDILYRALLSICKNSGGDSELNYSE